MRKRCSYLLFTIILITATFAGWVDIDGSQTVKSPVVHLDYSDYDSTIITVSCPGFFCYDTTVNSVTYKRLFMPQTGRTEEVGEPMLPIIYEYIGIPPTKDVSISVQTFNDTTFSGWTVFPLQDITDTTDTFIIDSVLYASDTIYHDSLAYGQGPDIMRTIRVCRAGISLFSYDIQQNEVRVSCSLRVKLEYDGVSTKNVMGDGPFPVCKPYAGIFDHIIINYDDLDIWEPAPVGKLLIVTLNDYIEEETVIEYLEWKHKKGDSLFFSTYDTPPDTSITIREAIASFVDRSDTSDIIGNVLIIGGTENIPIGTDSLSDWYASDAFYSCVGFGDLIPDIPVGRFSGDNIQEINEMINKTYSYERHINSAWNPGKYLFVSGKEYPSRAGHGNLPHPRTIPPRQAPRLADDFVVSACGAGEANID